MGDEERLGKPDIWPWAEELGSAFYMVSGSMDNFWLVMAVRYGIPGWFFVTAGYAYAVIRIGLHKCGEDAQLQRLHLAWMITFGGLTFSLVTVHVWTNLYSFRVFCAGRRFLDHE